MMRYFKCLPIFLVLLTFGFADDAVSQKKEFIATVDKDGVQRVAVLAGEYFFDPDHIIVKVNVPVEIRIKKEPGIVPHSFVVKAPEGGMDVLESVGSEEKTIKFTPSKTGKYPFYCDKKLLFFKSHREQGMEGVLEVRD